MESINESTKLISQALESLKCELQTDLPDTWSHEGNIKEVIAMLEAALDKLLTGK